MKPRYYLRPMRAYYAWEMRVFHVNEDWISRPIHDRFTSDLKAIIDRGARKNIMHYFFLGINKDPDGYPLRGLAKESTLFFFEETLYMWSVRESNTSKL